MTLWIGFGVLVIIAVTFPSLDVSFAHSEQSCSQLIN